MSLSGLPLFESVPYQPASETSKAAADSIRPRAASLELLVLKHLAKVVSSTDEEIGNALGLQGNTARPRRIRLVEKGHARDSGLTVLTASGRSATLWEITDAGRVRLAGGQ